MYVCMYGRTYVCMYTLVQKRYVMDSRRVLRGMNRPHSRHMRMLWGLLGIEAGTSLSQV